MNDARRPKEEYVFFRPYPQLNNTEQKVQLALALEPSGMNQQSMVSAAIGTVLVQNSFDVARTQ